MSTLVDLHIKLEGSLMERLKKFCLHRGDMSYLISLSIKKYVERLEEESAKADVKLIHQVEL
jgi:hypothetical protein